MTGFRYVSKLDPSIAITDPTLDETGRYAVDPETYYHRVDADAQSRYEAACLGAEARHEPLTAALVALGVRRADCHVDQTGGMVFCFRLQLAGTPYIVASIEQDGVGGSCAGYTRDWDDESEPTYFDGVDGHPDWARLALAIRDLAVAHGYRLEGSLDGRPGGDPEPVLAQLTARLARLEASIAAALAALSEGDVDAAVAILEDPDDR